MTAEMQKSNIKMENDKLKFKNECKKKETTNHTPIQSFFLTGQANNTNKVNRFFLLTKIIFLVHLCYLLLKKRVFGGG